MKWQISLLLLLAVSVSCRGDQDGFKAIGNDTFTAHFSRMGIDFKVDASTTIKHSKPLEDFDLYKISSGGVEMSLYAGYNPDFPDESRGPSVLAEGITMNSFSGDKYSWMEDDKYYLEYLLNTSRDPDYPFYLHFAFIAKNIDEIEQMEFIIEQVKPLEN
jgi:hypothetical protein